MLLITNREMGVLLFSSLFVSYDIILLSILSMFGDHSSRTTKLIVHIIGALLMLNGFLIVSLHNESYSLPLSIVPTITLPFVGILSYEHNKSDEINDFRDHEKQLSDSLAFSGTLTITLYLTLISDFLFSGFENHTTSDKRNSSLYDATYSICFISYIIGVINMLLNSLPPKVHCKAHREMVMSALCFLDFLFILLVIVAVFAITAVRLHEYALLEIVPQLVALTSWLKSELNLTKDPISTSSPKNRISTIQKLAALESVILPSVVALLTSLSMATNPKGFLFLFDSSPHSYFFILFFSMALTSYLSKELITRKQPRTHGWEQAVTILSISSLTCLFSSALLLIHSIISLQLAIATPIFLLVVFYVYYKLIPHVLKVSLLGKNNFSVVTKMILSVRARYLSDLKSE